MAWHEVVSTAHRDVLDIPRLQTLFRETSLTNDAYAISGSLPPPCDVFEEDS